MENKEYIRSCREKLETSYTSSESAKLLQDLWREYQDDDVLLAESVYPDQTLDQEAMSKIDDAIERLLQHEPIQYIIGHVPFRGLSLEVTPAVLIPRPETEQLVEYILSDVDLQNLNCPLRVMDLGTGSGCIALGLSNGWSEKARCFGVDVSADAVELSRRNAAKNNLDVEFYTLDILQDDLPHEEYDVIVSNPPYILEAERQDMESRVLDFEPHLALFAEEDGLIFYKKIIDLATSKLSSRGKLYFEANPQTADDVLSYAGEQGLIGEILPDLQGRQRFIVLSRDYSLGS